MQQVNPLHSKPLLQSPPNCKKVLSKEVEQINLREQRQFVRVWESSWVCWKRKRGSRNFAFSLLVKYCDPGTKGIFFKGHSGPTQSPFLFLLVYRRLLFLLSLSRNGTIFYSVYSEGMAFSSFNNDAVQVSSCVLELASRDLHLLASKGSLLLPSLFTKN